MNDELISALRNNADHYGFVGENGLVHLLTNAADAIENTSKAYQMMAEAYEAEVAKQCWIPVEERLPQETQRCIVVSKCGEMAFAIYKGNDFQYPYYMGKATHWMPLPEPPKEE